MECEKIILGFIVSIIFASCELSPFKTTEPVAPVPPIQPEETYIEKICIIVVKTPAAAEYIGEWFESEGYYSPFDGCAFGHEVGTWVCGELVEMGHEWVKLEGEIERLQKFLAEIK